MQLRSAHSEYILEAALCERWLYCLKRYDETFEPRWLKAAARLLQFCQTTFEPNPALYLAESAPVTKLCQKGKNK